MTADQITAIGVVIAAITGLVAAIGTLINARRVAAVAVVAATAVQKVADVAIVVDETHKVTNQLSTNKDNYIGALTRELVAHGHKVPVDQSLGVGDAAEKTLLPDVGVPSQS